jgi:glycosyltransferase involved in cell wall biosynthesis
MNSPLNILLTDASDIYGGGEYFVLELARALRARNHNVRVSCRRDNLLAEKCLNAGIPLFPVDYPANGRLFRTIRELRTCIRMNRIDIVHTNNNYDRTAGAFAARMAGAKHVTNIHSFHSIQHNLTHWYRNRNATDHFLVDGYCVKDLLEKEDGLPASKISVIHLGVDPAVMKRDENERARCRREFGVQENEIVIGNVGRLVPMKGQAYLVKAFARVVRTFPSARLLLVGDGELKEQLRSLALQEGAAERILFAGFRDDLVSLYSAFDIYAHASIEGGGETFPFAVLQALAQELPAVVTNVGDVAQMVENGVNGFVVGDKDDIALGEAIAAIVRDESLRRRMAGESAGRFLRDFTLEKMTGRIVEVYEGILHPGGER